MGQVWTAVADPGPKIRGEALKNLGWGAPTEKFFAFLYVIFLKSTLFFMVGFRFGHNGEVDGWGYTLSRTWR